MASAGKTRPKIPPATQLEVWVAAGGRCTFCNAFILENERFGAPVPIGELAHNVGWSRESPRGDDPLSPAERQAAANLILACRNCHKPVDRDGYAGLYTVEELRRRKIKHETRIRRLTAIGADQAAYVLRVVGDVRGVAPELGRHTVLTAATTAEIYPAILPGAHWADVDLDLRGRGDLYTGVEFERLLPDIQRFADRVHDGVRRDDTGQLALFAFARIPLLIALGSALDDKVPTTIFQRQRRDDVNAWVWPDDGATSAPAFAVTLVRPGSDSSQVALLLNLSGEIKLEELPADITPAHSIYALQPAAPAVTGPSLISSRQALANFEAAARRFLAQVERDHGKPEAVAVFPAIPVSAAVTLGRVLMPTISPAWRVYDRDAERRFFMALEVRR